MKKFIISIIFCILGFLGAYSQVSLSTCAYVNGYWTSWDRRNFNGLYRFHRNFDYSLQEKLGVITGMEFRERGSQPWDWCFKFEMYDYVRPDKKTRKQHHKNNIWYEYSGWVEYYVRDEYPTIEKVLEAYQFPMIQPKGETARAKRRARATIRIAPYKEAPECFNIYFDGVAVGISFSECPFKKSYFIQ